MNFEEHLRRQIAWSIANFGPGNRKDSLVKHMEKELDELMSNPDFGKESNEWVDLFILSLDGLWRSLSSEGYMYENLPRVAKEKILYKQVVNEQRDWPNWREADLSKPIEHLR